jgi:hypothetical protein
VVAGAVITALHPIYWVVAGLGAAGLIAALFLREVKLSNRIAPQAD